VEVTLRTGQSFDRYRIEAVLGEGGMGAVYRAYDTRLQRVVALKVLRPSTDGSTGGTGRILREARAAAALSHPNAVVIHDVGEFEGTAYIAMEHIDGVSLRAYVTDRSVDLPTRMRWLVDVASVLAAAHERGLVHRDVKPENVMVRVDGTVKVLDFGIARRVRNDVDPSAPTVESSDPSTHTGEGVVAGTPAYMAPEQVRNEPVDERADQFSWAVMAYEVLSGKLPWKPRDQVAIIASIIMDEPAPLRSVVPEVDERVSNVLSRALTKAPAARHPSMRALIAALEDRAAPPVHRRGRWPLVAGLIAVGAIAVAVVPFARRRPAPAIAPSTSAVSHAVTDHPDPLGCNDAAIRAHRNGLQALRQIGWDVAQHAFEAAIAADPSCAAPHLRLALMGPGLSMASARVRATFQKAVQLRANLMPRERDLLDAAEPCIARDPPDRAECATRARPLADKWPLDAEVLFWVTDLARASGPEQEALLQRAIAIDPGYADALQALAGARVRVNDITGALQLLDRCIATAPASTDCRFERVRIDFRRTDCKSAEKNARDWSARAPGQAFPQRFLAYSLAAQGEPRVVVEEALRARSVVLEEEFRTFVTTLERAQVAAFYGDFTAARTISDELQKQAVGSDYPRHAEAAVFAARLAEEEGRTADAKAIANAFRLGARVWPSPTVFTPYTWTATPSAAPVLLQLEGLAPGALRTAIADWHADAKTRVATLQAFAFGPSSLAVTKEEAEAASSSMPLSPLRLDADGALLRGNVGRLLQRAGRSDDALIYLRAAAADCGPLDDAFSAVRAHAWLAELLETRGDRPGACAEYGVVLDKWAAAKKSITADHARARRKALGCSTAVP
jgi:tetratricopeptide (TPR) repeat protein